MTRLLVTALAVAVAASAFATDSRTGLPDQIDSDFEFDANALVEAEVLICLDTDANAGFADLTPLYSAAFTAAGASPVATCAVEASGGTINFPPGLTANNYPIVVVLTSENWWSSPQNIDPEDETALADYLESGGNLLLVGQDYMYGAHPTMGVTTGFPFDYLGLSFCYQDIPATYDAPTASISGSSGWIFEGESAFLTAADVFLSNNFYGDCADPGPTGGYGFYYDDAAQEGVVVYNETETFKTIWAGIELAAAPTESFNSIIEKIYDWFVGTTPVKDTSWGRIKAMYDD